MSITPHVLDPTAPADNGFAVTPADATDLTHVSRGLFVGVAGDVKATLSISGTVTFKNLAAGVFHPLQVRRVWSTGTTATDIVAVY